MANSQDAHLDEVTISDAAEMLGLTHRALRFYEGRGLIKPRRSGPNRLYSRADITKLERIVQLTRYGFTLAQIKKGVTRRDLIARHADLVLEIEDTCRAAKQLAAELDAKEDGSYG